MTLLSKLLVCQLYTPVGWWEMLTGVACLVTVVKLRQTLFVASQHSADHEIKILHKCLQLNDYLALLILINRYPKPSSELQLALTNIHSDQLLETFKAIRRNFANSFLYQGGCKPLYLYQRFPFLKLLIIGELSFTQLSLSGIIVCVTDGLMDLAGHRRQHCPISLSRSHFLHLRLVAGNSWQI